MHNHIDGGFAAPTDRTLGNERRTVAVAQLVTTVGLALCTLIAATVISAGMARANVASNIIDNEGSVFALALLLGLLFIGVGGITFLHLPHGRKPRP